VYNVLLDPSETRNRVRSARLLADAAAHDADLGYRVIVAGDLGAVRMSHPLRALAAVGLRPAGPRGSTYHFGRGLNVLPATDHVLTGAGFAVWDAWADRATQRGTWPSDHYPVYATLTFR